MDLEKQRLTPIETRIARSAWDVLIYIALAAACLDIPDMFKYSNNTERIFTSSSTIFFLLYSTLVSLLHDQTMNEPPKGLTGFVVKSVCVFTLGVTVLVFLLYTFAVALCVPFGDCTGVPIHERPFFGFFIQLLVITIGCTRALYAYPAYLLPWTHL